MGTINTVTLSGRLTADPTLRYTQSGTAVAECNLAVEDGYGEHQKTFFPSITAWKHNAEYLANYGKKGMPVTIQGRYTEQNWEKDGQKHRKSVIVAENIVLPPKSGANESTSGNNNGLALGEEVVFDDSDLPF